MATATLSHHPNPHPWGSFGASTVQSPPPVGFNVTVGSPPPTFPQPCTVPPRNTVDLDRNKLIEVIEYFSQELEGPFNKRPIRLVVHGGACMLLHPGLYALSFRQHQLSPSLPHRTKTRDVDYIHRSFVIEMNQLGVQHAAEKLKACILKTAVRFNLGADWMNSDADIALPMANAPNGMSYDPIYHASVQPNNMDLHTLYRTANNMVTLISVTPFWAVSLKLVRYSPQDAADICLLLRHGVELSQVHWTVDTLKEWLFANCWPMGYSSYAPDKLKQLNIRLDHAIKMVLEWGQHTPPNSSNPGISGVPRTQSMPQPQPQQQQPQIQSQLQQPLNSSPTQLQLDSTSTWSSTNPAFPSRAAGTVTPLAAMGGGGEVVGGEHGRGWSWSRASPHIAPLGSSHNSPMGSGNTAAIPANATREPWDFSVTTSPPPNGAADSRRRSTAPATTTSPPPPSTSPWGHGPGPLHHRFGSLPLLNGKSDLERTLENVLGLPYNFTPNAAPQTTVSPANTMPYMYSPLHAAVIPQMANLEISSSSGRKRDKDKDKEAKKLKEREKERDRRKKEKLKDKAIRQAREHNAGERRALAMGQSFMTIDGQPVPLSHQAYYERALGHVKKSPRRDAYREPAQQASDSTDTEGESEDDDDESSDEEGGYRRHSMPAEPRGWGEGESLLQPPAKPPQHPPPQSPYHLPSTSTYPNGPVQPLAYYGAIANGAMSASPSKMPQSITPPSPPKAPMPTPRHYQQPRDQHMPPVPPMPMPAIPRDQHLPPVPPIASPLPPEMEQSSSKDRSKEKKARKEKKREKSKEAGERVEPFIPPPHDYDEPREREAARSRAGSLQPQGQAHQHNFYQQQPQQQGAGGHHSNMYHYDVSAHQQHQHQQQQQHLHPMYQYQQPAALRGPPP